MQSARSSYNHEEPGSRQIGITQRGLDIPCMPSALLASARKRYMFDYRVRLTWTFDR